jgi:5,10-methenyltetrahydrofolate synthetase
MGTLTAEQGVDGEDGAAPCLLHELGPDGSPQGDARQALDVARWRKAERERLIGARLALPAAYRAAQTEAIAQHLDRLLPAPPVTIISVYWPIRAEPDLRHWMKAKWDQGFRVALPVAIALRQPLVFREWRPGCNLSRGLWKIPYPVDGAEVIPTFILAPVVGFDANRYRLGYGGGFFDRTLARNPGRSMVIGVGYPEASIKSIFPQPHDIPMKRIVAGADLYPRGE